MNWYRKAYRREETYLRDYLKEGFDPYAYSLWITDYLDQRDISYDESEEYYEIFDEWYNFTKESDLADFRSWVEDTHPHINEYEGDRPAYEGLHWPEQNKPGWLVHFTDDPWGIALSGFKYGHSEFEGLHLTTYKPDKARKNEPGYNFAFDPSQRYMNNAAHDGKYGKHAVVFWGTGIKADHSGDEETQVIFWGPSVSPDMIFPVIREGSEWTVQNYSDRVVYRSEEIDSVVSWVENNWRTLQHARQRGTPKDWI